MEGPSWTCLQDRGKEKGDVCLGESIATMVKFCGIRNTEVNVSI